MLYESSMLEPTITVAAQQLCLKLAKHVPDIITDYPSSLYPPYDLDLRTLVERIDILEAIVQL